MGVQDPTIHRRSAIATVPSGEAQVKTASVTVPQGSSRTFAVTTFPDDTTLNLWNFLWSIYVDVDDSAYDLFNDPGSILGSFTHAHIFVMENLNWAASSDRTNQRFHGIKIINDDGLDHTFYLKYKAYTQATSAGT